MAKKKAADKDVLPPTEQETLEDLLDRLGIEDWDWLLIGDGSGSNWNNECGWATVSIERQTFERRVWFGAMSRGTVNFAEMMAYLQPLNWYASQDPPGTKKGSRTRRAFRNVHIVTDSEYCKNQGQSENLQPRKNASLWRVFDAFTRQGILLHWHWTPRNDVELNTYADALSKKARLLLKHNDVQRQVETDKAGEVTRTVYDFNP